MVHQSVCKVKHPLTTPLARHVKKNRRRSAYPRQTRLSDASTRTKPRQTRVERKAALIDLCAWAIATGDLELVARSWSALEEEVHRG